MKFTELPLQSRPKIRSIGEKLPKSLRTQKKAHALHIMNHNLRSILSEPCVLHLLVLFIIFDPLLTLLLVKS